MNEALVVDNLSLAAAMGARCISMPIDDAQQEAAVALIKAAGCYDPQRGVKFTTFATTVIHNHLMDASSLYAPLPVKTAGERVVDADTETPELKAAMKKLMWMCDWHCRCGTSRTPAMRPSAVCWAARTPTPVRLWPPGWRH